ncbi:hypothetical protein [Streptomyces sp. NPDC018711]|uniref:hypothetical protein n=1 Tax=Streptomyces sp. NPDC018711 TaxID=3365052 RepID=UPI003792099E
MPGSVLPTGPVYGPDALVIRVDSGGEGRPAVDVRVWPDVRNADLAADGSPTRYYFQPPRVTLAPRPGTTDLAFSATVMVRAPAGPHPQYLGGSCKFTCTAALPGDVLTRMTRTLATHDHPDPPARIASLFPHRNGAPEPELTMLPLTGNTVSCVVEQPPAGPGPLFLSVQGGPGGGIGTQALSSFLVSFSPAAAEAVVTRLRDAAAPPFTIRNVLTEQFDTGAETFTADLRVAPDKLHEVFAAASSPGEPWPAGETAATAYRSGVDSGAVRITRAETGDTPLDPALRTWLGDTDAVRKAVFVMVKDKLFDIAAATDTAPQDNGRKDPPAPAWWSEVFGAARVTLKGEPVGGGELHEVVPLRGVVSVEQTIEGDLEELAAAARAGLGEYLTVIAI